MIKVVDVEYPKGKCWCCGTQRCVIHNPDGTKEEFCMGRIPAKGRPFDPCRYLKNGKCIAKDRRKGRCRGKVK